MQKKFNLWNTLKQETNERPDVPGFKIREIWFIRMGKNVGFEEDGKGDEFLRPILIIRKFNNRLFWGIPLTSRQKEGPYYCDIGEINGIKNTAILSQLRLYDGNRLVIKIAITPRETFSEIQEKVKRIIDTSY